MSLGTLDLMFDRRTSQSTRRAATARTQNAEALCETNAGASRDPKCPKQSIVGTASVKSPLLPAALTGPVYFVKGMRTTKAGKRVPTLRFTGHSKRVRSGATQLGMRCR